MAVRTDLAIELTGAAEDEKKGVSEEYETCGEIKITKIGITSSEGEKAVGKPMGTYITVEFPPIYQLCDCEDLKDAIVSALKTLVKAPTERLLVVGLGNEEITPDSIGPRTAKQILATRHISGQFAEKIGLKGLKSVSVLAPGVLGKTGIESSEIIKGAVLSVKPSAILVIDALAARNTQRLFQTVQLCDTGISPGSGVKNARHEISKKSLGVPVVAVGVPTVVDAYTLAAELTGKEPEKDIDMFVTPKEADLLCDRISEILSLALNQFLQPEIDSKIIAELV